MWILKFVSDLGALLPDNLSGDDELYNAVAGRYYTQYCNDYSGYAVYHHQLLEPEFFAEYINCSGKYEPPCCGAKEYTP